MRIKPDYNLKSIYDINLEELKSKGIKVILFDLDSTIMVSKSGKFLEKTELWLEKVKQYFQVAVISNNYSEEYLDKELVKRKYISLLSSSHEREILIGSTIFGTHKDDIEIKINGKNARSFASQGQQRSLALALKLAEGEICKEEFGDYPVFLFDDVLSELDDTRRDYLIRFATGKQVIITTCEMSALDKLCADKKILVKNGTYKEMD